MKRIVALLLALAALSAAALAEDHGALVLLEYSESGGMVNASLDRTLSLDAENRRCIVTLADRTGDVTETNTYTASPEALDDLDAYLRANCPPEDWASLPESEIFALDAPTCRLSAVYADGTAFALDDDRELPDGCGPLLWVACRFMESYAAQDARTFEVRFSSFGGSGTTIWPVISAPEILVWRSAIDYGDAGDPIPPGSGYDEVFTFRGRVPGEAEVFFEISSPTAPTPVDGEAVQPKIYRMTVDDDYNVTCEEAGE